MEPSGTMAAPREGTAAASPVDSAPASSRAPAPQVIPFGNPDELLNQTPRHTDVVLGGKRYRLRALWQSEAEEVSHASLKASAGPDGKDIVKADFRGRAARAIAFAWIREDGTQVIDNPLENYRKVNDHLSPQQVRAMFKAIDELSAITEESKDELGKDSGETRDAAG